MRRREVLEASAGSFGRVGETFWRRRREVLTRRLECLDASVVNLVASAKELSPSLSRAEVVSLPMQPIIMNISTTAAYKDACRLLQKRTYVQ